MLSVTSNLDAVIADLKDSRTYMETVFVRNVMQPDIYLPELKDVAEQVLNALTTEGEKQFVPALLDTVMGVATHDGMVFEMLATNPGEDLAAAEPGFNRLKPLEQDIADWIREHKEHAETELSAYGGDYNKFAQHIMAVIQNDPSAWLQSDNPTGLLVYLQTVNPSAFAKVFGLTSLPYSRVSELLEAVLAYWHQRMGVRLMAEAMQEVEKAFS